MSLLCTPSFDTWTPALGSFSAGSKAKPLGASKVSV